MSTNQLDTVGTAPQQTAVCANGHIVEIAFLLQDWQVAALETAAHSDHLSCGQLVRRVICDFLGRENPSLQRLS